MSFLDVCRFTPTLGGTTDWTFSAAVIGYQSPTAAGVVNGKTYRYRAESADLSQWEVGTGAYNTSTGVLARTTVLFNSSATGTGSGQSGAGTKISFSTVPQVAVVALAEDLLTMVATVTKQVFTSSGTYTPTVGMLFCLIEAVGGGAGGGSAAGAVSQNYGGGGGGSGSPSRLLATAATIGASKTVTIGAAGNGGASGSNNGAAGGDTSVGTLCIAKGGTGGTFGSGASFGVGGAGGVSGTGDVAGVGDPGLPGLYNSTGTAPVFPGGTGGSSIFGGGAPGTGGASGAATAGSAATGFGSGGAGAVANNVASNAAGGNGSSGIVFITEYCGPI